MGYRAIAGSKRLDREPYWANARIHQRQKVVHVANSCFCIPIAARRSGVVSTPYVFRKLGVRTASEINEERIALKFLRGDFQNVLDQDSDQGVSRQDVVTIMEMVRC